MLKFTAKDREQLAEMRHGWLSILLFAALLSGHAIVDSWFGRGWAVVAAAVAAALWFIIRPWRFGLLPPHTRRVVRLTGIVVLTGYTLISLLKYWRALR